MAYIGLGSNLGHRVAFLRQALRALQGPEVGVRRLSSLYESGPLGPVAQQPDFINAVVEIETSLDPHALLDRCLAVESGLGRQRERAQGPRTIDLDLILMDELVLCEPRLTLPHPEMTFRAFVLAPLLEIAPHLKDPRNNMPMDHHLVEVQVTQRIKKLEKFII